MTKIQCMHGDECRKCQYARYKRQDPVKVTYQTLKYNSKRRGKEFTITLKEFREFCVKTKYMTKRGIFADSYHIDRIDETKGYTIDNIQVLTNSENVIKFIEFSYRDQNNKPVFITKSNKNVVNIEVDTPF